MSENPYFKIKSRSIGYNYEPLVVAEIGINHGGNLNTAKAMVDAAISGGAEVIKHQTHIVEDEMSQLAKKTIPGNSDKSIYEIMDDCSLSESEEYELMKYVESRDAIFISTPFSRKAVHRLENFGVSAYKIGSGECNNYPLLDLIADIGKPIILSTGMNSLADIRKSVDIFERKNVEYALLHTTNLYPTPYELVRLGAVTELAKTFPNAVIGLSDHTIDNLACLGAVALGASILERHFTDSFERIGPDIICSMDAEQLKELISCSKNLALMRGGSKVDLLEEEQVTRDFAFSTVVTIKDIKKGEIYNSSNTWVKRPGIGDITAEKYHEVCGKKASTDILADTHLTWGMIQ
ncbi:N-acetylneuraminate synthase family protein [Synechococcus sp. AH-551-N23]|nr:N-acetylneuraminate synthase family protein [Synechococcus sp. AH-551-N23]